ncbi:major capsid protein [Apis mellifera associated microvirus 47]|nr:major capsid protein [Apis mellifera associated microvirus 47]
MKRNKFSLSHYNLVSLNQGRLVPIGHFEVLPGDTIQMSTSALVRAAPLVAPIMHPVHVRIHHWFVPYRLLWTSWEDFITGGDNGTDASVPPYMTFTNPAAGSLANYMGVPTGTYTTPQVSAFPFRAYVKIFNEWYRDQDLVSEQALSTASGLDTTTATNTLQIAWEKDYFTSARPWEQKGAAVTIPLQEAPYPRSPAIWVDRTTGAITSGAVTGQAGTGIVQVGGTSSVMLDADGLQIDVNDLRESLAIQRYQEARARFGSRYTEYLRYLGVKSSDARLQRPEYLGGGKQTLQFSEVLQTAEGTNPVGMMRGHGIGAMRSNRFRRFFEEHGIVMTLMSVKPRTMYMQAMHRSWFRQTKEDYWQKELEHIGQQEVYNREIYALGGSPTGVFGYQDRYDEYRRHESRVAGEFASTLKYWHMARDLASQPTLNSSFVQADPTTRVYAATTSDQLYCMAQHSIQARRMVAKTGSSFIF